MVLLALLAGLTAIAWAYLLLARGNFWLNTVTNKRVAPAPAVWPTVTVVIPARNEAATIAVCVRSIVAQDYPGRLDLIVVDDDSSDDTARLAAAAGSGATRASAIVSSRALPGGWTGKLWALKQGIAFAEQHHRPDYLLFTDADIAYAPDLVRRWCARGERGLG